MPPLFDTTGKAGTASGALLIILANIQSQDLLRTAALAAIGAIVSFCVTYCLKLLLQWWQKR